MRGAGQEGIADGLLLGGGYVLVAIVQLLFSTFLFLFHRRSLRGGSVKIATQVEPSSIDSFEKQKSFIVLGPLDGDILRLLQSPKILHFGDIVEALELGTSRTIREVRARGFASLATQHALVEGATDSGWGSTLLVGARLIRALTLERQMLLQLLYATCGQNRQLYANSFERRRKQRPSRLPAFLMSLMSSLMTLGSSSSSNPTSFSNSPLPGLEVVVAGVSVVVVVVVVGLLLVMVLYRSGFGVLVASGSAFSSSSWTSSSSSYSSSYSSSRSGF